jgi:G3E family GTPase
VLHGAVSPAALFGCAVADASRHAALETWLAQRAVERATRYREHHERDLIASFCIVRDEPVHAAALALFVSALAENCGPDLLRVKGIVNVAEVSDRPAVIHGVQHVYHAPVWLERWPSQDRRTRIVFIGRRVSETWVRMLLDVLDDEVADETATREFASFT